MKIKRHLTLVPAPRPLTVEQRRRREEVERRALAIQAGVKAPASGIFGGKGKAA